MLGMSCSGHYTLGNRYNHLQLLPPCRFMRHCLELIAKERSVSWVSYSSVPGCPIGQPAPPAGS